MKREGEGREGNPVQQSESQRKRGKGAWPVTKMSESFREEPLGERSPAPELES